MNKFKVGIFSILIAVTLASCVKLRTINYDEVDREPTPSNYSIEIIDAQNIDREYQVELAQNLQVAEEGVAGAFDGVGNLFDDRLEMPQQGSGFTPNVLGTGLTPNQLQDLEGQFPEQSSEVATTSEVLSERPIPPFTREDLPELVPQMTKRYLRSANVDFDAGQRLHESMGEQYRRRDSSSGVDMLMYGQNQRQFENVMQNAPENGQRAFGGVQNMFGGEQEPTPFDPVGEEYQGMLSTLETEHSLPSGLLNQVMMMESSGRLGVMEFLLATLMKRDCISVSL